MSLGCVPSVPLVHLPRTILQRLLWVLELADGSSRSAVRAVPDVTVTDPKVRDEGLKPLPVMGRHGEGGIVPAHELLSKDRDANWGQSEKKEDEVFIPVDSLAPGQRVLEGQCDVVHVARGSHFFVWVQVVSGASQTGC